MSEFNHSPEKRDWAYLEQPMHELILLFYNRSELTPLVLIDCLKPILNTFFEWKQTGDVTAQSILNFMIDQVLSIIAEIKTKLLLRAACKFEIIRFNQMTDADSAEPANAKDDYYQVKVRQYSECPVAFDKFIYTVWKYLDMVTSTSHMIEDLYLTIIEALELQLPNKSTIFRGVHWQSFRNVILTDKIFRSIFDQIEEFRESGYAQNNSGKWLDRIQSIR